MIEPSITSTPKNDLDSNTTTFFSSPLKRLRGLKLDDSDVDYNEFNDNMGLDNDNRILSDRNIRNSNDKGDVNLKREIQVNIGTELRDIQSYEVSGTELRIQGEKLRWSENRFSGTLSHSDNSANSLLLSDVSLPYRNDNKPLNGDRHLQSGNSTNLHLEKSLSGKYLPQSDDKRLLNPLHSSDQSNGELQNDTKWKDTQANGHELLSENLGWSQKLQSDERHQSDDRPHSDDRLQSDNRLPNDDRLQSEHETPSSDDLHQSNDNKLPIYTLKQSNNSESNDKHYSSTQWTNVQSSISQYENWNEDSSDVDQFHDYYIQQDSDEDEDVVIGDNEHIPDSEHAHDDRIPNQYNRDKGEHASEYDSNDISLDRYDIRAGGTFDGAEECDDMNISSSSHYGNDFNVANDYDSDYSDNHPDLHNNLHLHQTPIFRKRHIDVSIDMDNSIANVSTFSMKSHYSDSTPCPPKLKRKKLNFKLSLKSSLKTHSDNILNFSGSKKLNLDEINSNTQPQSVHSLGSEDIDAGKIKGNNGKDEIVSRTLLSNGMLKQSFKTPGIPSITSSFDIPISQSTPANLRSPSPPSNPNEVTSIKDTTIEGNISRTSVLMTLPQSLVETQGHASNTQSQSESITKPQWNTQSNISQFQSPVTFQSQARFQSYQTPTTVHPSYQSPSPHSTMNSSFNSHLPPNSTAASNHSFISKYLTPNNSMKQNYLKGEYNFNNYQIIGEFPVTSAGLMDESDDNVHVADKRIDIYQQEPKIQTIVSEKYFSDDVLLPILPPNFENQSSLSLEEIKRILNRENVMSFYNQLIEEMQNSTTLKDIIKLERIKWHPDKWLSKLQKTNEFWFNIDIIHGLSQILNNVMEEFNT